MLWLILGCTCIIFSIIIGFVYYERNITEDTYFGCMFASALLFLLFLITTLVQMTKGIRVYPALAEQYEKIKVYNTRILDVRRSTYTPRGNSNKLLISGSIENIKQSTYLSQVVSTIGTAEGKYLGELKKYKIYKNMGAYYWFSYGWAISDDIDKLPVIEIKNYEW